VRANDGGAAVLIKRREQVPKKSLERLFFACWI
jgi:hypothetical protein